MANKKLLYAVRAWHNGDCAGAEIRIWERDGDSSLDLPFDPTITATYQSHKYREPDKDYNHGKTVYTVERLNQDDLYYDEPYVTWYGEKIAVPGTRLYDAAKLRNAAKLLDRINKISDKFNLGFRHHDPIGHLLACLNQLAAERVEYDSTIYTYKILPQFQVF